MQIRFIGVAATLTTTAVVSGCGLIGPAPSEEPPQSGKISIDGTALSTEAVDCTQQEWSMMIDAKAEQGSAQVFLELGGEQPIVRTVTIAGVNDINGSAGGDVGEADARIDGNVFTISGTVVGADGRNPAQMRSMPFEIKAPC